MALRQSDGLGQFLNHCKLIGVHAPPPRPGAANGAQALGKWNCAAIETGSSAFGANRDTRKQCGCAGCCEVLMGTESNRYANLEWRIDAGV